MKLEQQVVSLGLAKKMKELGFEKESYFEWRQYEWGWNVGKTQSMADELDFVSAYTVAELGEMLSGMFNEWSQGWNDSGDFWRFHYGYRGAGSMIEGCGEVFSTCEADTQTEADARALLLIYLTEKKN